PTRTSWPSEASTGGCASSSSRDRIPMQQPGPPRDPPHAAPHPTPSVRRRRPAAEGTGTLELPPPAPAPCTLVRRVHRTGRGAIGMQGDSWRFWSDPEYLRRVLNELGRRSGRMRVGRSASYQVKRLEPVRFE